MQVIENVALISINATMLVQLISFLIFMVLFNRIMIRPLRKVMLERDAYLVQTQEKISQIDQSYQDIARQIRAQEDQARKAALEIRKEIEASGAFTVKELMFKTRQDISRLRSTAQKDIDANVAKVRASMVTEVDALADQMIASVLGRRNFS